MSTSEPPKQPPGRDAPYGHILTYWMDTLGVSNQALAKATGLDRSYPGKIKQGIRLPAPVSAEKIRKHLLKIAKARRPYGSPPLTEFDLQLMDDLLRMSFAREDRARERATQPADRVGTGSEPHDEGAMEDEQDEQESTAAANTGDAIITVAQAEATPHHRPSLSPLATIGLSALALVLMFGGVVYYVTHASPPRTVNTPGQAYAPQQLHQAVIRSQPPVYDALTAPDAYRWDRGPMPGGACQYQSGGYHATVVGTAVVQCLPEAAPPLPSSGTVGVQVDLTFLQGDGGAGLVLCYAGLKAPYYRFVVKPDGHFDLFDPVTLSHVVPAVKLPPDTQYRLTAIVRATGVYLFINGVFMVSAPVERGVSLAGQVGVFSVNGVHNPTDVVFHNFTVWELPALR